MIIYIEHIPSGKHWTVSEDCVESFNTAIQDWWDKGCCVSMQFLDEHGKTITLTGNITKNCIIERIGE